MLVTPPGVCVWRGVEKDPKVKIKFRSAINYASYVATVSLPARQPGTVSAPRDSREWLLLTFRTVGAL